MSNGHPVNLGLWDTFGSKDEQMLRLTALSFPQTNVFAVCFSITDEESFNDVGVWVDVAKKGAPEAALVLAGFKEDLAAERTVSIKEAQDKAKALGMAKYVECSALTQKNLKELFDSLVEA
eukprot:CAMPEP_0168531474 /NCGR_PEP_ID=MMETSP0405-20121227/15492_1 /TAXON_ID=498012 /ORGANISM="Trichosphaerium sp, Strain Am-I-7 wt" /LENGTH=120 /DNA_ID=CAMNT_0008556329 /DNA_START=94 /DNA_END=452 /DNA_ORIENTATION=-